MSRRGTEDRGDAPRERDVASDAGFFWRFVKTMLGGLANDLGRKGYDVKAVQGVLVLLEEVLGPQMTAAAINAMAAAIQNPAPLKAAIVAIGLPAELNSLIDDFLDDLFEGLRMAYRTKGTLTEKDSMRILDEKRGELMKRLETNSFTDALLRLSHVDRGVIIGWVGNMNPEEKKTFEFFREKLKSRESVAALAEAIVKSRSSVNPNRDVFETLKVLYGEPPKPKSAGVVATTVAGATKSVTSVVQAILADPSATLEKAAAEIHKGTEARRTDPARVARRAQTEARKKSWK